MSLKQKNTSKIKRLKRSKNHLFTAMADFRKIIYLIETVELDKSRNYNLYKRARRIA